MSVSTLQSDPSLSVFYSLVERADASSFGTFTLIDDPAYTVLAPDNEAMYAWAIALGYVGPQSGVAAFFDSFYSPVQDYNFVTAHLVETIWAPGDGDTSLDITPSNYGTAAYQTVSDKIVDNDAQSPDATVIQSYITANGNVLKINSILYYVESGLNDSPSYPTPGNDTLTGTSGNDDIDLLAGDDI